ncbi:uncharacterized protein LOC126678334 [Mercurialis annua]|uniref:uncharacterized protein LOC126678334 n=1 Tax=Mercurialis annua TaxID=3986 RepID=UPI00215F63B5|nr:uncharacterized protein LOC126678334 [Mercurialis annua]
MCVDYTDLNKVCPKDIYRFPDIDDFIDLIAGHAMYNLDDAAQGATYQRLMNFMFKEEIRKRVQVYVDDLTIKTENAENHAKDLEKSCSCYVFDLSLDCFTLKVKLMIP